MQIVQVLQPKLLLFAVCQMGKYTSMYVTFDRFPFDLLYHCQFKRPHPNTHNETASIFKSYVFDFSLTKDFKKSL